METEEKNFFESVYEIARQIPEGRLTSFGAIAKAIGAPRSARMVGWALNNSPDDVPAHRVLNRKGLLTGKHHFQGSYVMQQMLENEGVKVVENTAIDFDKLFWNPLTELPDL